MTESHAHTNVFSDGDTSGRQVFNDLFGHFTAVILAVKAMLPSFFYHGVEPQSRRLRSYSLHFIGQTTDFKIVMNPILSVCLILTRDTILKNLLFSLHDNAHYKK